MKCPCHPIALILYSKERLLNENVNIYWLYEMSTVLYEMDRPLWVKHISTPSRYEMKYKTTNKGWK